MSRASDLPPSPFKDIVSEAAERIQRANNIILRNVPEALVNADLTEHDSGIVHEIIQTLSLSRTEQPKPVSIRRGDRKVDNKPRALKVYFSSGSAAVSILKAKKKFTNTTSDRISIHNYRTPRQAEYLKQMRLTLRI